MWRLLLALVIAGTAAACAPSESAPTPAPTPPESTATTVPEPHDATTAPSRPDATSPPADGAFEVLVFHKTEGFRHDSIPAGIDAFVDLGERQGFSVVATEDASVFTDEGLAAFEVIVFLNTTGDILDASQEQAMERFISEGNGFVGVHAAADTEYEWPWYGRLVGAYFAQHPAPQTAAVNIVAPDHPAMAGIPGAFERFDEWYDFQTHPGPDVTILASLDETSYDGGEMGDPHPIVWAHESEGGRSHYTGFGHTPESFTEPLMRDMLANAVLWAAGRG